MGENKKLRVLCDYLPALSFSSVALLSVPPSMQSAAASVSLPLFCDDPLLVSELLDSASPAMPTITKVIILIYVKVVILSMVHIIVFCIQDYNF